MQHNIAPKKSKIKCLTPDPDSNAELKSKCYFKKLKSLEIALSPAKRILVRPVACMLAHLRGHTAAYLNQFNCIRATSTLFSISPLQQMNNCCSAKANS